MNEAEELTWGEFLIAVFVILPLMVLRILFMILFVIHDVAAWLVLLLARDWIVMTGDDEPTEFDDLARRGCVLFWLFVVPPLAGCLWLLLVARVSALFPLLAAQWFLRIWSMMLFVGCYYWRFFAQPLRHKHWPQFMAAQQQLVFGLQCEYVIQRLKIGVKLADWWDSLTE